MNSRSLEELVSMSPNVRSSRQARLCLLRVPVAALALALALGTPARGETNLTFRVATANLTGNAQKYEAPQIRILQGLKPDIVAIQEFNYLGNTPTDLRSFVNEAFGTNFVFYRESGYSIPNGIISRWPISNSGSWPDASVPDRGFAWAQIDLPGSHDLYVVSVHLYASGSSSDRNQEALAIKNLVQANFPSNAWVIVAGDLNTDYRSEAAITTLKTFLSDSPVPTDAVSGGSDDTNLSRSKPYDYVLPSFSMTNRLTAVVFPSHSFSNGLVFDSRIYMPLSDVAPVQTSDSSECQHMAVLKYFSVNPDPTNRPPAAPEITDQPDSLSVTAGTSAPFTVTATGDSPLSYQWRFGESLIPGAASSNYIRPNVKSVDAGDYTVVITNSVGSITSDVATLTVLPQETNTFSEVLAGWDVSGLSGFGPSPFAPTTNAANVTVTGLTRGSGVTTLQTAAARAWGGNGFDAPDPTTAASNDESVLVTFIAHPGFKISFESVSRFDYRRSSTGPANGVLQYRVGTGAFHDIIGLTYASSSTSGSSLPSIDLTSVSGIQNVGAGTNVTFRLLNYSATSINGTWYVFDVANSIAPDFAFSGRISPQVVPPTTPTSLLNPVELSGHFHFDVVGQVGSECVIEIATNLSGSEWISVQTNTIPFSYAETNLDGAPVRIYRGQTLP